MPRIKLTDPGMSFFNGLIGRLRFNDGVSVDEPTEIEIRRIGAAIGSVLVDEDGNEIIQAGDAAKIVANRASVAPPEPSAPILNEPEPIEDGEVQDAEVSTSESLDPSTQPFKIWTKAELEEVADAKGIRGLRDIGEPLGARHTSIMGLIDEILVSQKRALGK